MEEKHKPIVETIINTAAIAISAYGVQDIIMGGWKGYIAILFATILEWFKYYGRLRNLW